MTAENLRGHLVMGPLLNHWQADKKRDFYFRIADEADFDVVCLGEAVCGKRIPLFEPFFEETARRLKRGGKTVIRSTLALVDDGRDMDTLREHVRDPNWMIEANDLSAVSLMEGRPFTTGPFVNVYNEDTLKVLADRGAVRVCPPAELPVQSLATLAAAGAAELEVQVFGRAPLAISARCHHARAHNLSRGRCRQVCGSTPDGMIAETLDGEPFATVSGQAVLSHSAMNLMGSLTDLLSRGIRYFRLHPHDVDMVEVAALFRSVLDGRKDPDEAGAALNVLMAGIPLATAYRRAEPAAAAL